MVKELRKIKKKKGGGVNVLVLELQMSMKIKRQFYNFKEKFSKGARQCSGK